jgi:hypothetical protein
VHLDYTTAILRIMGLNITCRVSLPRFYEFQASGTLPSWNRARRDGQCNGWRDTAHDRDGRGPGAVGADLSGGWYDAGGMS